MMLVPHPAAAEGKICKDGEVHYHPGVFATDRRSAETTALQVWKEATGSYVAQAHIPLPKFKTLKCNQSGDGSGWRCFVKASGCAAG